MIYSWNLNPELIEQALAGGASGYLSKVLTGPAIVEALERIMGGEIVVLAGDFETSVGGAVTGQDARQGCPRARRRSSRSSPTV